MIFDPPYVYIYKTLTKHKDATVQTYIRPLFALLAVIIEKYTIVIYIGTVIHKFLQVAF